jgi:hypothetical protein
MLRNLGNAIYGDKIDTGLSHQRYYGVAGRGRSQTSPARRPLGAHAGRTTWFHQTFGASVVAWLLITLSLLFWLTLELLIWLPGRQFIFTPTPANISLAIFLEKESNGAGTLASFCT